MIIEIIEDEDGHKMEFYINDANKFYINVGNDLSDLMESQCVVLDVEDCKVLVKRLNEFING
jgi:hypothetical protein